MVKKYGVGLKEYNGDYLDDVMFLEYILLEIIVINVVL